MKPKRKAVCPLPAGQGKTGARSRIFPKCNRHFDEFIFREKMARRMEDFPCIRLAFWRGRGQAG